MKLGMQVGLRHGHIVLDGDPAPRHEKRGGDPSTIFGPFLLWPNCWIHQDSTWYRGRPQPRGLCVTYGPSPSPKRGRSPKFSADVYCGQTTAWIKMSLGTEVGLGPDDIVLDGDPAPRPQIGGGAPSPIFGPCLSWLNGLNFRHIFIVAKRLDASRCHLVWR